MLTASRVLDQYYLDARCMLLEIAATLDRYDRAVQRDGNGSPNKDKRLELLQQSLALLANTKSSTNRSEQLLNLFSDP